MTFKDYIAKKTNSHSRQLPNPSSLNRDMKRKHHQKFKRLHISVLDLLQWYPSKQNIENKNIQQDEEKEQDSFPRRQSIIKSSDAPRILSKKSVTFASAFDLIDNKQDIEDNEKEQEVTFNLQPSVDDEISPEEDLVMIIPDKKSIDGTPININEDIEPYPFRSEIPLSQKSSLNDDLTNSDHSSKNLIQHFINHHHHPRPKKIRQSTKIIDSISKMNRSNSAPNLIISSSLSQPSELNNQQDRLKSVRTWFKLTTVGRFVNSLHKKSTKTPTNKNSEIHSQSTELRRLSELLY